jgi:hypothetical protein
VMQYLAETIQGGEARGDEYSPGETNYRRIIQTQGIRDRAFSVH